MIFHFIFHFKNYQNLISLINKKKSNKILKTKMATNLNRPVVKLESVKPVVGKPSVHPFSNPQVRPAKSKPSSHGLPRK